MTNDDYEDLERLLDMHHQKDRWNLQTEIWWVPFRNFRPLKLARMEYSPQYGGDQMPIAIFEDGTVMDLTLIKKEEFGLLTRL